MGCARLARALERDGLKTAALHGDKSQDERLKALDAFKKGEVDLLVCTDVAARGLDIKDVPAVFNIDIPFNAEDYVHRIGRTGCAGAQGQSISFVSASDQRLVVDIEKLLKVKIELEAVEFEEDKPRGRINTGRRAWGDDDPRDVLDAPRDSQNRSRSHYANPPRAKHDPFFDQPYEEPSADAVKPVATQDPLRKSPNIKPKRNVAALFKTTA